MITLGTLHLASAQEVFDQVVLHLRTQGKKSIDENYSCLYRGPDGTKCAAGCLISDSEYKKTLEGLNWSSSTFPEAHKSLIAELQSIHDHREVCAWEAGFEEIAEEFNLNL